MDQHAQQALHERALNRVTKMKPEERLELLKRAGILGADGRLAARYRKNGEAPKPARPRSNGR
jgi:hypothetical protein